MLQAIKQDLEAEHEAQERIKQEFSSSQWEGYGSRAQVGPALKDMYEIQVRKRKTEG